MKQTFKIVLQIDQAVEDPKCVAPVSLNTSCVSEVLKKYWIVVLCLDVVTAACCVIGGTRYKKWALWVGSSQV